MSTVLVVEDHPLNRKLVRDLLENAGHTVVEAIGVEDGWARLEEQSFDFALLDIQIPGGGGEALLDRIRANEATAGLPVAAVTALAMPGDRERLLTRGFDAYASKPLDLRAFMHLIRRLAGE